jgi:prepilin-type N-terminal cleavage/methylation domain-containing protein
MKTHGRRQKTGDRRQKSEVTRRRLSSAAPGFTLIEVLTVLLIITVLMGLVIGGAKHAWMKSKRSRAQAEIATIEMALENYKVDNGYYPAGDGSTNSSSVLYSNLVAGSKRYLNFRGNQLLVTSGITNGLVDPFSGTYYYQIGRAHV